LKIAFSFPAFVLDSNNQAHVSPSFRTCNRRLNPDYGRVRTIISPRVMHGVDIDGVNFDRLFASGTKGKERSREIKAAYFGHSNREPNKHQRKQGN
jgi:uncharacterized lipoprotein YddW (UPF0748 family)